ncbi:MAG: patatin-like phospholipase family protein [Phycisphaerales bacterium]
MGRVVLSLPGGGIRALAQALLLEEIERTTGEPIRHQVDLVAGTSGGGIVAAAIAAGIPLSQVVAIEAKESRENLRAVPQDSWSKFFSCPRIAPMTRIEATP